MPYFVHAVTVGVPVGQNMGGSIVVVESIPMFGRR
jgi:hypothetical protein